LEIVSQPDLRSPAEAKAYLDELKLLLGYLGVSDCNMQEGSLRVDANINLHLDTPQGTVATPIVEVKNMNSFRAVERALDYEARRQYEVWKETGVVMGRPGGYKTTRGWDEDAQATKPQRTKEESSDYRYFPDPDLVPVTTTERQVESIRASLGELPAALRERLQIAYDITPYDADVLVNQGRALVDYFLDLADRLKDGKMAANWVQQDVLRWLNDRQLAVAAFPVSAESVAGLLKRVKGGELTTSRGRDVLAAMIDSGKPVDVVMRELGIESVDQGELENLCRQLLAANPRIVEDVKEGRLKAIGSLVGQAKSRNPNVNPSQVRELCLKLIGQM
jgi:aspartyl-tRNA(Asn)/glutamyl-tRNA(Gln) amidotransferase subunit B